MKGILFFALLLLSLSPSVSHGNGDHDFSPSEEVSSRGTPTPLATSSNPSPTSENTATGPIYIESVEDFLEWGRNFHLNPSYRHRPVVLRNLAEGVYEQLERLMYGILRSRLQRNGSPVEDIETIQELQRQENWLSATQGIQATELSQRPQFISALTERFYPALSRYRSQQVHSAHHQLQADTERLLPTLQSTLPSLVNLYRTGQMQEFHNRIFALPPVVVAPMNHYIHSRNIRNSPAAGVEPSQWNEAVGSILGLLHDYHPTYGPRPSSARQLTSIEKWQALRNAHSRLHTTDGNGDDPLALQAISEMIWLNLNDRLSPEHGHTPRPYQPVRWDSAMSSLLGIPERLSVLEQAYYQDADDFVQTYESYKRDALARVNQLLELLPRIERPNAISEPEWNEWTRDLQQYLTAQREVLQAPRIQNAFSTSTYRQALSDGVASGNSPTARLIEGLEGADLILSLRSMQSHLDERIAESEEGTERAYLEQQRVDVSQRLMSALYPESSNQLSAAPENESEEVGLTLSHQCFQSVPSAGPQSFRDPVVHRELLTLYAQCRHEQGEGNSVPPVTFSVGSHSQNNEVALDCNFFRSDHFPTAIRSHYNSLLEDEQCFQALLSEKGEEELENECTDDQRQAIERQNCFTEVTCQLTRSALTAAGGAILVQGIQAVGGSLNLPGCPAPSPGKTCDTAVLNGFISSFWETIYGFYELGGMLISGGRDIIAEFRRAPIATLNRYRVMAEDGSDHVAGFLLYLMNKQIESGMALPGVNELTTGVRNGVQGTNQFFRANIPLFGFAQDSLNTAVHTGVRWTHQGFQFAQSMDPSGTLQRAEDRVRTIHQVASRLHESSLNDFIDNPIGFTQNIMGQLGDALWNLAVLQFGCADPGIHLRGITECENRVPAWDCASCVQRTQVFCEMGGFVGGEVAQEVVAAILTAGAANAIRASTSTLGRLFNPTRMRHIMNGVSQVGQTLNRLSGGRVLASLASRGRQAISVMRNGARGLFRLGQGVFRRAMSTANHFRSVLDRVPGLGLYLRFTDSLSDNAVRAVFGNTGGVNRMVNAAEAAADLGIPHLSPRQIEALESATSADELAGALDDLGQPLFSRQQANSLAENGRLGHGNAGGPSGGSGGTPEAPNKVAQNSDSTPQDPSAIPDSSMGKNPGGDSNSNFSNPHNTDAGDLPNKQATHSNSAKAEVPIGELVLDAEITDIRQQIQRSSLTQRGPPPLNAQQRRLAAEETLGRPLTESQAEALERAHAVGHGQPGRDGTVARHGNYTDAQLREKAQILRDAGFDLTERGSLLRNGIAGDDPIEALSEAVDSYRASLARLTEERRAVSQPTHPDQIEYRQQRSQWDARLDELIEEQQRIGRIPSHERTPAEVDRLRNIRSEITEHRLNRPVTPQNRIEAEITRLRQQGAANALELRNLRAQRDIFQPGPNGRPLTSSDNPQTRAAIDAYERDHFGNLPEGQTTHFPRPSDQSDTAWDIVSDALDEADFPHPGAIGVTVVDMPDGSRRVYVAMSASGHQQMLNSLRGRLPEGFEVIDLQGPRLQHLGLQNNEVIPFPGRQHPGHHRAGASGTPDRFDYNEAGNSCAEGRQSALLQNLEGAQVQGSSTRWYGGRSETRNPFPISETSGSASGSYMLPCPDCAHNAPVMPFGRSSSISPPHFPTRRAPYHPLWHRSDQTERRLAA